MAVRLIVDRAEEVRKFVKEEFWSITAQLEGQQPPIFASKLIRVDGKKITIGNEKEAKELTDYLQDQTFQVAKVTKKERKRRPVPPFITSKLQQEAARKLNFTARRTMQVAQQLYEGIELGQEGPVGLITYMRTDSTRLSKEAVDNVRALIEERYGEKYLPDKPLEYVKKKRAQDAHEAIRPTHPKYDPEHVRSYLSKEQYRLYSLIWKRFVACQMMPAVFDQTSIDIEAGKVLFRATGQVMRFDGFTRVYTEGKDEKNDKAKEQTDAEKTLESASKLPPLEEGQTLTAKEILPQQHFTQPPPYFRESSLVKELEEKGIGRPSTYASILSVIQDKKYAEKKEGRFFPTELGRLVTELLVEHFPDILDVKFTANMEANLDRVETEGLDWVELLRNFHEPFEETLKRAKEEMRNVKREGQKTDVICSECGSHMVIKWGRNGEFIACSSYPECKNTGDFERTPEGKIQIKEPEPPEEVEATCPECDAPMLLKNGRFGRFLACSRYPECKTTQPFKIGVACPEEDCDGDLVEKRSRRGKTFYSCSNYPKCEYASWDKPLAEACPVCEFPFLVDVEKRRKNRLPGIQCPSPSCDYRKEDELELEEGGSSENMVA